MAWTEAQAEPWAALSLHTLVCPHPLWVLVPVGAKLRHQGPSRVCTLWGIPPTAPGPEGSSVILVEFSKGGAWSQVDTLFLNNLHKRPEHLQGPGPIQHLTCCEERKPKAGYFL